MGKIGFYFFNHFIAYYGLMMVIGLLVNIPLASIQLKRFRLSMNEFAAICGISALFAIIGAKILYLIIAYKDLNFSRLTDLQYLNSIMSGGFVFLGGIVGIVVALLFCEKKLGIFVQPYSQACMGCLPMAHGFGRIGCFLVGCCYGIPYEGQLSIIYTQSQFAPCGIALFPVQLVEAGIEFVLGSCLFLFSTKLKGYTSLALYLLAYTLSRFVLEFLRYDEIRGSIAGLSTSQLLSAMIFFPAGIYFIDGMKGKNAHKNK